jgi:threonine synthase
MHYISTRGQTTDTPKTFSQILLEGLAPDGGLYLPQQYPMFGDALLTSLRGLSYPALAGEIISLYATDIPRADLQGIINKAYTQEVFGSADITPVKTLAPNLHLLQCSNGPTLAFKDIAMQFLGHLFEYVLAKSGGELNILGATSGDTGSSAEHAMKGKRGVRVFMLSPAGKMSPFQTAQMFSLQEPNIINIACEGVFDDCQDVVKAVSNDLAFKAKYHIGAVNSINWARIVAQVVYYFKAYFAVTKTNAEKVSFAVPSGNFGNILAGHIARQMGLPIDKLILATNENDVLDEFFKTGKYRPRTSVETRQTSSPSMDISKASNFERFMFDVVGRDSAKIRALWAEVDRGQGFDISASLGLKPLENMGFISGRSTHAERLAVIKQVWDSYEVEIDTHTADGIKVVQDVAAKVTSPVICLETALPAKFEAAVTEALGHAPHRPQAFANIEALPQRFIALPADADTVKQEISRVVALQK